MTLGTAKRNILAVHDPATAGASAPRAAVICNPLGSEYVFAHRSLRHLALRLARRGFDTLRFDYFGTGDSGGSDGEVSRPGMCSDVEFAIEAARDIAGVRRITLLGLREGAAVAAHVACLQPGEIESLVLWDPPAPLQLEPALRARSLLVSTQADSAAEGFERIPAPCCWIEDITISGALPVAVFQRIEEWLR